MNETTILEKRPNTNGQQPEKKNEGSAWKHVTLGGVSGILMGAGLLYAGQATAKELESTAQPKDETPEVPATAQQSIFTSDDAFNQAADYTMLDTHDMYQMLAEE